MAGVQNVVCVFVLLLILSTPIPAREHKKSHHTNNWAVLVCASRYWFNYRHIANALSMYRSVKRLGIPDSNIILMLADDMACDPRNPRPATIFNNVNQHINVYGDDVEVDYRGYELTVENFIRVLTGRLDQSVPRSKRLLTDEGSNILVYMTGHGGEGFLKFQDTEEISNAELADAFEQMWQKKRYNELLFIIDTCQAVSMYSLFYSPNIIGVGSSQVGEDSLSHHMDSSIGVHMIDRWTYYALEFLEKVTPSSRATMADFFGSFDPMLVRSRPGVRTDLFERDLRDVLVTDFFGSVRKVELTNQTHFSSRSSPPPVDHSLPFLTKKPEEHCSEYSVYTPSLDQLAGLQVEQTEAEQTSSHPGIVEYWIGVAVFVLICLLSVIGLTDLLLTRTHQ